MSTRTPGISLVSVLMAVLSAIPVYGGLRSAVDPETGSLLSVDGSFELGAGSLVLLHRGPQDADFEEREVALSNVSRKPEIQQVVYTASMKEFVVFFTATGDGADTKLFVLKVDAKTGEPRGNPIEVPIRQDDGTVIRTSSAWHGAMEAWFIAYEIRTPLAATRVGEGGAPPTSEIRVERTDAGFRSARDPWSVLEHRNPAIQVHRGGKVRVVSNNNNVVTAFDLDVESLEELGRSDTSLAPIYTNLGEIALDCGKDNGNPNRAHRTFCIGETVFAFTAETDDCSEGTGVGVTTVTETLAFGPVEEGGHCNATSSPVHFQNLDIVYNDWSDQFSLVWCVSATPESPERYCGKNTGYTVDEVGGFAVPGDPERAAASWATRNGFDSQSEGRGLRRTSRSGGELVVSDFFILGEGRDASVVSLHRYPGFGEITVEGDILPMWFVDNEDGSTDLASLPLTLPCFDLDHSTCLNDDAFRVHAQFATAQGTSGVGRTVELTEDTGYFTFFDEDNVEVVVKVLDACGVNGHRWVFAAGLTNVAVNLIVKSPEGVVREYVNLLQQDFQPILDTLAFECPMAARRSDLETSWFTSAEIQRMSAPPERHRSPPVAVSSPASGGACVEDATTHCLSDERFRVTSSFRTANGTDGNAQAQPITSDTGYFTFFDEDNVEVVVKVLDACGVNGYRWVFAAGLTNVEVDLDVEDTETGETVSYRNPLRTPFQPILDTSAFACE